MDQLKLLLVLFVLWIWILKVVNNDLRISETTGLQLYLDYSYILSRDGSA